jgi:hypothetical protein
MAVASLHYLSRLNDSAGASSVEHSAGISGLPSSNNLIAACERTSWPKVHIQTHKRLQNVNLTVVLNRVREPELPVDAGQGPRHSASFTFGQICITFARRRPAAEWTSAKTAPGSNTDVTGRRSGILWFAGFLSEAPCLILRAARA